MKNPAKEAEGGNNGGSVKRKQVCLKPACPSFQPAAAEIRNVGSKEGQKQLAALIEQQRSCQTYLNLTENRIDLNLSTERET